RRIFAPLRPGPLCLLFHEGDPGAVLPAHSIVKSAKAVAVDVVLKVSRIEMVGEIENFQPQLDTIVLKSSLQTESPEHLKIKRGEAWITSREIAWTDKIAVFIDDRVGEAGAQIQNRRERDAIADVELTTEKETIGCVPRQARMLVGLDDRVLEVTEVGIEVVQISAR